jgi:hypothetical protein
MIPVHRTPCAVLLAFIAGLGSVQAVSLEGLVKNSPFGGTGQAAGPGAAPSTLEFRGMYAEGGVNYYSIYNTQTKQSSWVTEGEAPSVNVPVVIKGFDIVNEALDVDNGGQPQQMALHQAVVVTYKGPSPAQLAAVSAAAATSSAVAGAVSGSMPPNLTPEQVEAFRQSMRDRYSKGGVSSKDGVSSSKTSKKEAPAPSNSSKTPKTPKIR